MSARTLEELPKGFRHVSSSISNAFCAFAVWYWSKHRCARASSSFGVFLLDFANP
jgi:hypothetical protein